MIAKRTIVRGKFNIEKKIGCQRNGEHSRILKTLQGSRYLLIIDSNTKSELGDNWDQINQVLKERLS